MTDDRALYVISVAARLAGVHPQTLRMYERKGLLRPARTEGNDRRYSERDVEQVKIIQSLTQRRGVNLAGVELVVTLQRDLVEARSRMELLEREVQAMHERMREEIERVRASFRADLVPYRADLIPYPKRDPS